MFLKQDTKYRLGIALTDDLAAQDMILAIETGGAQILSGTGVPDDSLGQNGDVYIDSASGNFYKKISGSWVFQGTFAPGSVPPGGTTGQALIKLSDTDGDFNWGNYIPTGNANAFAGFDSSGNLYSLPGFNLDTNSGGLNEQIIYSPSNDGGLNLNIIELSFEPLQDSPGDSWTLNSATVNFDTNDSGFDQGTNGEALTLYSNNINHQGTGDIGSVAFIKNNFNIGNGTDPITVKGVSYSYGFGTINSGVTLSGALQGYGFQPNIQAGAFLDPGTGTNVFYDFANINTVAYSYNGFTTSPTLLSIANNNNYQAFASNPNITTLTGNAGATGFGFYGNIGTMGTGNISGYNFSPIITNSGTGGVTGMNINPTINGGSAGFTGININPAGGSTLSNVSGLNINLSAVNSADPQGVVAINSDSRLQINASTQLRTGLGFQIGSRLEHLFQVPLGSPVTGTDELAISFAGDFLVQDDVANGGFGIGFNSIGAIGSVAVATGKTVDAITVVLAAASLPDPGFATGGNITDFHIIRAFPPLPQGGTANITNLYAFKLDSTFGDFGSAATNAWGLFIDSNLAENYIGKSLVIGGGTHKVSNSDVGLEIASTKAFLYPRVTTAQKNGFTAINGMAVYDTDLNKFQGYENGAWVNLV